MVRMNWSMSWNNASARALAIEAVPKVPTMATRFLDVDSPRACLVNNRTLFGKQVRSATSRFCHPVSFTRKEILCTHNSALIGLMVYESIMVKRIERSEYGL